MCTYCINKKGSHCVLPFISFFLFFLLLVLLSYSTRKYPSLVFFFFFFAPCVDRDSNQGDTCTACLPVHVLFHYTTLNRLEISAQKENFISAEAIADLHNNMYWIYGLLLQFFTKESFKLDAHWSAFWNKITLSCNVFSLPTLASRS